jgi:NADPH:quinone reductase-like Zn-dependent oxidoreductase
MKATNGKGVDVILNSLSGDFLDESWRCIADEGRFVDIGKKDMIDRNTLSMEPFCRNASYCAVDLSLDSIPLSTIARSVVLTSLHPPTDRCSGCFRKLSNLLKKDIVNQSSLKQLFLSETLSMPSAICVVGNILGRL